MVSDYSGQLWPAQRYCAFLERVCNGRTVPERFKSQIINRFLAVKNIEELRQLCEIVSTRLRAVASNPDYFTVE